MTEATNQPAPQGGVTVRDSNPGVLPSTSRPAAIEGVPEKFLDPVTGEVRVADLVKSYVHLERQRGAAPAPAEAPPADPATPAPLAIPNPPAETPEAAAQAAGLDVKVLVQKIAKDGDISAEDYAALAKAGYTEPLAKSYVESVKIAAQAQIEKAATEARAYIGGEAAATELMTWAASNLPDADKARLNEMLAGPSWRDAVDIIKTRQQAASKTAGEPNLVNGNSATQQTAGYRARAEMVADMQNPEYAKNPEFRDRVARKMAAATWDLDARRN
jgi:hypothetical protein